VRSYVEGEQWQTFRQKADKITIGVLFIIIVLAIIFVCQLIRKFFAKLFKRAEKTKKASKQEPTATKNDRKKIKKTTPPRDEKGRFIKNTQSKKKQTKIKPKANINQKNGLTPNSNYLSLNKIKTRRNSRGG
jgi:flagellar biosynthesis/type III secretory pathway M-ring protein FliF/YscJ